ncbi:MAG: hypothetical protein PWP34_779 [Desulfuromonadales bacterium]|jgi:sugar O-acyltransferase (sialic acid O-acetyltransferase NeuD family)|nr:hypothetical protein [Desulfuromonadales bacterium]
MNKKDLILVGGGGHCHSVIDVIEALGDYRIAGVLDLPERAGSKVLGYTVIGCDDDIPRLIEEGMNDYVITLGQIKSPDRRISLFREIKSRSGHLPAILSPLAHVSPHAAIGEGTIVMHGALVNAGARVGCNCTINSRALVEHDVQVDDHCHLSTACVINGSVRIGEGTLVGSGAVIRENIVIGPGCIIGAGALVRKSLSPGSLYVGGKSDH